MPNFSAYKFSIMRHVPLLSYLISQTELANETPKPKGEKKILNHIQNPRFDPIDHCMQYLYQTRPNEINFLAQGFIWGKVLFFMPILCMGPKVRL